MKSIIFHGYLKTLCYLNLLLVGMATISCEPRYTMSVAPYTSGALDSQVVIWKAPGASQEDFRHFIDGLKDIDPNMDAYYCSSCDSGLVKITSSDIAVNLRESGELAVGGNGGIIKPSGDTIAYCSRNFIMTITDPINTKLDKQASVKPLPAVSFAETKPVVVAIFDTGIDPELGNPNQNLLYSNDAAACIPGSSANGWNFADKNNDFADHYNTNYPTHGHGSNVSRFVTEQVFITHQTPVKILPVKFINNTDPPSLFDVLCGIAYAQERGAHIINASFGYYACKDDATRKDQSSLLFKKFIEYYTLLKGPDKIIMVAAAGNEDDASQRICGEPTRDLEKMHFYPASFAGNPDLPNVMAITTVGNGASGKIEVSPHQNFGRSVVDLGVSADIVKTDHFSFVNPRTESSSNILTGSSYAAPIVTGIIASRYYQLRSWTPGKYYYGDAIVEFFKRNFPDVIQSAPSLGGAIKNAAYVNHNKLD